MRLLFLNAFKGLKRKAVQMIGLIFLIMTSTGIFTMMNSSLDRMDSMAMEYLTNQKVEHSSIVLNNTELLTREDYDILFPSLQEEAYTLVTSDEFRVFNNELELRLAAASGQSPLLTNEKINEVQIKIMNEIKEEYGVDTLNSEQRILLSNRLVNYFNSQLYLAQTLLDENYVVKDVDVYLLFGSQSRALNLSTNSDESSVWYYFSPLNPEIKESEEGCGSDSGLGIGGSSELPSSVTQLYERYNAMLVEVNVTKYLEKEVEKLASDYDLTYEYREVKNVTFKKDGDEKSYAIAAAIYTGEEKVNIPYLIDGKFPTLDNEITLSSNFMESNNLKIGDTYNIKGIDYVISGSAYMPDYIYPAISFNTPVYDEHYHTVCYTTAKGYEQMVGSEMGLYSVIFNEFKGEYGSSELDSYYNKLSEDNRIMMAIPSYKYHPRIAMFLMEMENNRVMTSYLMVVLLAIAIFIIIMVMKKRIDDEKRQIGVLKSLGYGTFAISISYLVYPIVSSIIGGILGYILGIILQTPVVGLYKSYFNIPMNGFSMSFKYLGLSIAIPLISLTILSFLVAMFMLRHRPLKLLNEGSNLKVNRTTKVVTKLTAKLPFKYRFKYSLASRSLGKLLSITFSSFATGLLIVLTLIGSTMMNNFVNETFAGATYNYKVSFQTMQDEETDGIDHQHEDTVLTENLSILRVIKDDQVIEVTENKSISLFGVDEDLQKVNITNDKNEDISNLLFKEGNNIIINDPIRALYKLDVGDSIVLTKKINTNTGASCGEEITFKIVGINTTFSGLNAYASRSVLASYLGYKDSAYNEVWTDSLHESYNENNKDIASIFSLDDLKMNIQVAMDMMNVSIYLVVAFAGVMALVIIGVVSSVVIDENKKHISLMKVMGYTDKEINNVVLNIYTPFVIIAYLLSIPAMKGILNAIISLVAKDLDFTIPIHLGWVNALIGLAVILVAYFIALYASRRALNRIPLSEALKRE